MTADAAALVLYVVAFVLFLLAALDVNPFGAAYSELVAGGLAAFVLAHIVA